MKKWDTTHQREFLSAFAHKNGISHPCDWGKVNYQQIIQSGGNTLLRKHQGSLRKVLAYAFPGKRKRKILLCRRNYLEE